MEVITLVSNKGLSNTYIIKNNNKCVVVDCGVTVDAVKNKIGDCTVEAILLTHAHFDHIYYLKEYLQEFNCCVYGNKNCLEKFCDENKNESCVLTSFRVNVLIDNTKFKAVLDNEILHFLDCEIKVIDLPGHSSCSVGYKIENNLFSGDTIFFNGVGRYDFWDSSREKLIESLNKIKALAPINIYCGHGENFSL